MNWGVNSLRNNRLKHCTDGMDLLSYILLNCLTQSFTDGDFGFKYSFLNSSYISCGTTLCGPCA